QHGAPAGGQHDAAALRAVIQRRRLALAEAAFALDLENDRHADTAARFQLVVQVDELAPQRARQAAADGRLAGAHHAHQENRQVVRQVGARGRDSRGRRAGGLVRVGAGRGRGIRAFTHARIIPSPASCPLTTLNEFVTETRVGRSSVSTDTRKIAAMSKSQNSSKKAPVPKSGSPVLRFFVKTGIFFGGLALCGVLLGGMALALAWPNLPDLHAMTDYRPRVPLRVY